MSEKALLSLKREAQDYLLLSIFCFCIFFLTGLLLVNHLDSGMTMGMCVTLSMYFLFMEQYNRAKHSIYKVFSDKIYISDFIRYTLKEISMKDITEITHNSKQIVFKTDEEEYYFEGIKNITENYEKIKQIYEDYKNSKNV